MSSRPHVGRLGLFGRPAFAVYWSGGLFSNIGTWLQAVAASVFIYDLTGSALSVGVLNFATFLPVLLFSVTGGALADRLDRRLVVVATHTVAVLLSFLLAGIAATGNATDLWVIAIAFAMQTAATVAKPSLTAMIPALVPRERLAEAVSLNTLQFLFGQIGGPLLATLVLTVAGPAWAFAVNGVTFLGPIAAMTFLARRGLGGRDGDRAARAGGEPTASLGLFAYVRSQPWVGWALLAVIAASATNEVLRTTAPALVTQRLGAPSTETGIIVSAQSVGAAAGILGLMGLRRSVPALRAASIGFALQALGLAVIGNAGTMPVAVAGAAAVGMGFSLSFPAVTSKLQTEVPDALRGRLMSLHQMAHLGNRPFTALAAGAIASGFGAPAAALCAIALAPLGLVAVRSLWRGLARLEGEALTDAARG